MPSAEDKLEKLNANFSRLQVKNQKQRTEIARLTQHVEALMADKQSLLADIKWMRGEK
jgi:ABC-type transporter Mla subunit MlaD